MYHVVIPSINHLLIIYSSTTKYIYIWWHGGFNQTPLKNMKVQLGSMTFPMTHGKRKKKCSKPPTSNHLCHHVVIPCINHLLIIYSSSTKYIYIWCTMVFNQPLWKIWKSVGINDILQYMEMRVSSKKFQTTNQ